MLFTAEIRRGEMRQISITDIVRGTDTTLVFNILTDVALATAKFTAKRSVSNADNDAAALKVVTVSSTPDGQITGSGPPAAIIKIALAKVDTDNFLAAPSPSQIPQFAYPWDLEVFDEDGNSTTPVGGTIVVNERVRTAVG
jgi:hypothetical protein